MSVDLVPFALIRAVGQDEGHGLEESDAGGEAPQGQTAPTSSPSPLPVPAAPGTGVGEPQEPVDGDTVQVEVDGHTSTVNEGQQFAGNFELVSVSGNCARFLFGDESFSLCQGEAPK